MKPRLPARLSLCLCACITTTATITVAQESLAQQPPAAPAPPAAQAQDAVEIPFILSSVGGIGVVQGEFSGKVSVTASRLAFHFDKGLLKTREGVPARFKEQIVDVRPIICVAHPKAPFDIASRGNPVDVGREISSAEVIDVAAFDSSIELPPNLDLSRYWIGVQVSTQKAKPDGTPQTSFVYIQSARDFFTAER